MSRRASGGGKRPRQQQGEEEDAQPAPLHLTAQGDCGMMGWKGEAISSSGDPAYVNLKVREQEHDSVPVCGVTHFRMKRVTQLKKVPSSLAHS